MTRRAVLTAALMIALALPGSAAAHARLLSASPANGAVLEAAPRAVVLHFDDTVATGPGNAAVDDSGHSVVAGRAHARARTLTIPLQPLGKGSYSVRWSVVSDDGHTIAGVLAFAVGRGSTPHEVLSARSGPPAADVFGRWLLITGALLAAGAVAFLLAVGRAPRVIALAAAGFGIAAAGAGIEWARVPSGTRFGHAMIAAFVASLAGIAASAARRRALLAVPAVVLVAAPSLGGHALDAGVSHVQVGIDLIHLAAASVWVGGLAALVLTLPARDPSAARRFSRIALVAVLLVAATGILRAISELASPGQLFSTGYGRAIVVKTTLFVALIALGYVARSRLLGRPRLLRRSAAVELALLLGVTVAVAFLTSIAPGRLRAEVAQPSGPPPAPPPGAVTAARQLRSRAVAVAVSPAGDRRRVTVTVIGSTGDGVDGLAVLVDGESTSPCGAGCYESVVDGSRALQVSVGGELLMFAIPSFPLRRGGPLLREIGARYLRARTAVFEERLSSGPGQTVTSRWRLAAPASLAFRTSDGSSGIVIGGRRWDRQGAGRWVESPQAPKVPQLQLPWTPAPVDAVLLPPATAGGRKLARVSFVDPTIPAWYVVSADARTKELARIDMIAPAHFMRDVYTGLDVPLRITPPVR